MSPDKREIFLKHLLDVLSSRRSLIQLWQQDREPLYPLKIGTDAIHTSLYRSSIIPQNEYISCFQEEDSVKLHALVWKCRFYRARSLYTNFALVLMASEIVNLKQFAPDQPLTPLAPCSLQIKKDKVK